MRTTDCPECEADIAIDDDADLHDIVSCEECGTDFEIVAMNPLELDHYEDVDLDDDDEEF